MELEARLLQDLARRACIPSLAELEVAAWQRKCAGAGGCFGEALSEEDAAGVRGRAHEYADAHLGAWRRSGCRRRGGQQHG